MKTEEKNIEKAARKFFDEGNRTANEYIGFITGAKSPEARDFWINSQEAIIFWTNKLVKNGKLGTNK